MFFICGAAMTCTRGYQPPQRLGWVMVFSIALSLLQSSYVMGNQNADAGLSHRSVATNIVLPKGKVAAAEINFRNLRPAASAGVQHTVEMSVNGGRERVQPWADTSSRERLSDSRSYVAPDPGSGISSFQKTHVPYQSSDTVQGSQDVPEQPVYYNQDAQNGRIRNSASYYNAQPKPKRLQAERPETWQPTVDNLEDSRYYNSRDVYDNLDGYQGSESQPVGSERNYPAYNTPQGYYEVEQNSGDYNADDGSRRTSRQSLNTQPANAVTPPGVNGLVDPPQGSITNENGNGKRNESPQPPQNPTGSNVDDATAGVSKQTLPTENQRTEVQPSTAPYSNNFNNQYDEAQYDNSGSQEPAQYYPPETPDEPVQDNARFDTTSTPPSPQQNLGGSGFNGQPNVGGDNLNGQPNVGGDNFNGQQNFGGGNFNGRPNVNDNDFNGQPNVGGNNFNGQQNVGGNNFDGQPNVGGDNFDGQPNVSDDFVYGQPNYGAQLISDQGQYFGDNEESYYPSQTQTPKSPSVWQPPNNFESGVYSAQRNLQTSPYPDPAFQQRPEYDDSGAIYNPTNGAGPEDVYQDESSGFPSDLEYQNGQQAYYNPSGIPDSTAAQYYQRTEHPGTVDQVYSSAPQNPEDNFYDEPPAAYAPLPPDAPSRDDNLPNYAGLLHPYSESLDTLGDPSMRIPAPGSTASTASTEETTVLPPLDTFLRQLKSVVDRTTDMTHKVGGTRLLAVVSLYSLLGYNEVLIRLGSLRNDNDASPKRHMHTYEDFTSPRASLNSVLSVVNRMLSRHTVRKTLHNLSARLISDAERDAVRNTAEQYMFLSERIRLTARDLQPELEAVESLFSGGRQSAFQRAVEKYVQALQQLNELGDWEKVGSAVESISEALNNFGKVWILTEEDRKAVDALISKGDDILSLLHGDADTLAPRHSSTTESAVSELLQFSALLKQFSLSLKPRLGASFDAAFEFKPLGIELKYYGNGLDNPHIVPRKTLEKAVSEYNAKLLEHSNEVADALAVAATEPAELIKTISPETLEEIYADVIAIRSILEDMERVFVFAQGTLLRNPSNSSISSQLVATKRIKLANALRSVEALERQLSDTFILSKFDRIEKNPSVLPGRQQPLMLNVAQLLERTRQVFNRHTPFVTLDSEGGRTLFGQSRILSRLRNSATDAPDAQNLVSRVPYSQDAYGPIQKQVAVAAPQRPSSRLHNLRRAVQRLVTPIHSLLPSESLSKVGLSAFVSLANEALKEYESYLNDYLATASCNGEEQRAVINLNRAENILGLSHLRDLPGRILDRSRQKVNAVLGTSTSSVNEDVCSLRFKGVVAIRDWLPSFRHVIDTAFELSRATTIDVADPLYKRLKTLLNQQIAV